MNEPRVTWGADGWAASDGWELAHCADTHTDEYLGSMEVWVSRGCSLPAGAYLDGPAMQPEPGKAIVRLGGKWELVDVIDGENNDPAPELLKSDYPIAEV